MQATTKRWRVDLARHLIGFCLFALSHAACPSLIWDADKPWPISADPADNSCWMATGANMMAADGWGDAQAIYNTMRQNYTQPPNNQVWMWTVLGSPDMAINWVRSNPFTFMVDQNDIILESVPHYPKNRSYPIPFA